MEVQPSFFPLCWSELQIEILPSIIYMFHFMLCVFQQQSLFESFRLLWVSVLLNKCCRYGSINSLEHRTSLHFFLHSSSAGSRSQPKDKLPLCPQGGRPPPSLFQLKSETTSASSRTCPAAQAPLSAASPGKEELNFTGSETPGKGSWLLIFASDDR